MGERKRPSWQWWECLLRVDEPGAIEIRARATDMANRTQPEVPEWNRLGYGNNAIQKIRNADHVTKLRLKPPGHAPRPVRESSLLRGRRAAAVPRLPPDLSAGSSLPKQ